MTRARRRGPCSPTGADGRCATRRSSTACGPPARTAAALDWAGLHALRHTCASLLIDEGRSPVQIAAWLGHHSPAFSMAVCGHLMDDGVGEGLHLTPPRHRGVGSLAASLAAAFGAGLGETPA